MARDVIWQEVATMETERRREPLQRKLDRIDLDGVSGNALIGLNEQEFRRKSREHKRNIEQAKILTKQIKDVKPRLDLVAVDYLKQCVDAQKDNLGEEELRAVNGLLMRAELHLLGSNVSSIQRRIEHRRRQVSTVRIGNTFTGEVEKEYTGGTRAVAEFLREYGPQVGFNIELGSGKDEDGKPYIWEKNRRSKYEPMAGTVAEEMSVKEWDGYWQMYMPRFGKSDANCPDYIIASVLFVPGQKVEYIDRREQVVAYIKKDLDGVAYCSDDGYGGSEDYRTFIWQGVEYNAVVY